MLTMDVITTVAVAVLPVYSAGGRPPRRSGSAGTEGGGISETTS